MFRNCFFTIAAGLLTLSASVGTAEAALVINPGIPITHRVNVQPIVLADDDGSNPATYLGASTGDIHHQIDQIWAQAGIDVTWSDPNSWNHSFANFGNMPASTTRPRSDLDAILAAGVAGGLTSPDPHVLNMFFVRISPGHAQLSENSVAGLAQLVGGASTMFVGSNLPGLMFQGDPLGNDLVAKVIAHEIGHNLGLPHLNEPQNLMLESDGVQPVNAILNPTQIARARTSSFAVAVAVPEPTTVLAVPLIAWVIAARKRRGY